MAWSVLRPSRSWGPAVFFEQNINRRYRRALHSRQVEEPVPVKVTEEGYSTWAGSSGARIWADRNVLLPSP